MEYPSVLAGVGYAALGGVVLFFIAGVFVFMEQIFKLYLKFRGYTKEEIETNLPALKKKHNSAWYWIRTGFVIVPLSVWVLARYIDLLTGI